MTTVPKALYFDRLLARTAHATSEYRRGVRSGLLEYSSPDVRREWEVFVHGGAFAAKSKLILMPTEQGRVFLASPLMTGQDYVQWLRLPYPDVFIEWVDGPLLFAEYRGAFTRSVEQKPVMGVSVHEYDGALEFSLLAGANDAPHPCEVAMAKCARAWRATFWFPLDEEGPGLECHTITFGITHGNLFVSVWDYPDLVRGLLARGETEAVHAASRRFAVHLINFLSSPAVTLCGIDDRGTMLRKSAMRELGVEPPSGVIVPHVVEYRHVHRVAPVASPDGPRWKHRYQYDVRGHWMRFTKGRMTGRVIWCPPHRRGLANAIYRPSSYQVAP
jgi:hypothetical protein